MPPLKFHLHFNIYSSSLFSVRVCMLNYVILKVCILHLILYEFLWVFSLQIFFKQNIAKLKSPRYPSPILFPFFPRDTHNLLLIVPYRFLQIPFTCFKILYNYYIVSHSITLFLLSNYISEIYITNMRSQLIHLNQCIIFTHTYTYKITVYPIGARAQLLCGMWDLPEPGLEPVSPALAEGFLTTVPPGKPSNLLFQKLWLFQIFAVL